MAWLTASKLRLTARHDGGRLVSHRRANISVDVKLRTLLLATALPIGSFDPPTRARRLIGPVSDSRVESSNVEAV